MGSCKHIQGNVLSVLLVAGNNVHKREDCEGIQPEMSLQIFLLSSRGIPCMGESIFMCWHAANWKWLSYSIVRGPSWKSVKHKGQAFAENAAFEQMQSSTHLHFVALWRCTVTLCEVHSYQGKDRRLCLCWCNTKTMCCLPPGKN